MPLVVICIYASLLGLCFGSFANVAVCRLPLGESIVSPPSHCPSCNHKLTLIDLIPLLSYVFLRGRCRFCKGRISARYPVVEAACGLLFLFMTMHTGVSLAAVPLCFLSFILLCVSVIDADTQEIPDGLLIAGAAVGVCRIVFTVFAHTSEVAWHEALLGAVVGAAVLFVIDRLTLLIAKKDGFGFGDVKLMAMVGLFIGWRLTLVSFFFAFVAGGCYAAFLLATKKAEKGTYLAFAPFLSAGALASIWWGDLFLEFML